MDAVFLKVLNMSITASWLIMAVILTRLILKKAPKWIPCLLWGLVAIRLICPFSFESVLSLIPSSETIPANIAEQHEPAITTGISVVNEVVNPVIADSFTPAPTNSANPLQIVIPVAAIVWIAGIVIMLAYALISYLKLKKTVSVCVPAGEGILACDEVKAPFILGVFRPNIYVPSSMSGKTLDHVIRHERAHLQRHDHWWKPLGFLLLSVYWFNPLCWIAYILLCKDIEMACDEKVIRDMDKDDMAAYSQALLDCSFPRKRIAACPLAFGEVGVKERVKGVLNYKKPAFWIILIAIIACIVLAVCLMTDPLSNKSLSGKLGVSMDMAVSEHNRSAHSEGNFFATDYDVLLISESKNETTVYSWVLCEEYSFDGKDVKLESGSHIPTAITFDMSGNDNDSSTYDVIEYWEPRDGSYYADDIRAKFPWSIRGKALDITKSKASSEHCLQAAREYFGVNTMKDEPDLSFELGSLKAKYPDYFDLSTSQGLDVYVWQMSQYNYYFALLPAAEQERTDQELMKLNGCTVSEMRAILSTYSLSEKDIHVIPWQNPLSSYLGEYWIHQANEDPAVAEKRKQEYIDGIRQMLFNTSQAGGFYLTIGADGIKSIQISTPYTSAGCQNADGAFFRKGEQIWLECLEGYDDLRGVEITALDRNESVIWSAAIPNTDDNRGFTHLTQDGWTITNLGKYDLSESGIYEYKFSQTYSGGAINPYFLTNSKKIQVKNNSNTDIVCYLYDVQYDEPIQTTTINAQDKAVFSNLTHSHQYQIGIEPVGVEIHITISD